MPVRTERWEDAVDRMVVGDTPADDARTRAGRELSRQVALALTERLQVAKRGEFFISDWTRSHANFFRAVEIEKRVMFIILALIVRRFGDISSTFQSLKS